MNVMVIICAAAGFLLCIAASFAKSCMDTIAFRRDGFSRWPGNLRDWLLTMETDAKRKPWDGWHVCQSVWHLAYALGFFAFGVASALLAGGSPWLLASAFAGGWVLRLVAHGIGFTLTYPIT